ncbi:MAG: c-type cytochrome [Epsilonproteobacteria bacterium]|nr:c-type cytochrome [Campylobacterota bacterium]MBD3839075.1 c-type cytochrome [Campylobacterota bacterium]
MENLVGIIFLFIGATFANATDSNGIYNKCSACHGERGEKMALGKSAIIRGASEEKTKKQLIGYKKRILNQYGMGSIMTEQMKDVSDEDINKLAKYLSTLK